jgi:hypothetical protein
LTRSYLNRLALVGAAVATLLAIEARADVPEGTAREHFDRGLAATNEQRFADACDEFEAAYALSPDYRVLYNLGRVSVMLGRHVRAAEAFEAYLADGGDRLPEERRQEVARVLAEEHRKIGAVGVETAAGADVRIDGRLVGRAPLAGRIRVAAGKHTIEAWLGGQSAQLREIDVEGASTTDVTLPIVAATRAGIGADAPAAPQPKAVAATTPPLTVTKQPEQRSRSRVVAYVIAGTGLAVMLGGLALAYEGATAANAAKARLVTAATPVPPATPSVTDYDAAKLDYDNAKTRNRLGWTMGAIGGAALIFGGVILFSTSESGTRSAGQSALVVRSGLLAFERRW